MKSLGQIAYEAWLDEIAGMSTAVKLDRWNHLRQETQNRWQKVAEAVIEQNYHNKLYGS